MKRKEIAKLIVGLAVIQLIRIGIEQCIFLVVPRTNASDRMASMTAMILITVAFCTYMKKKKVPLSIFPTRFQKGYMVLTIVAALLFIMSPSNYVDGGRKIWLLLYSSIVIPVFEEVIFRGYIWNKLNSIGIKEIQTYLITTVLFGVWHLGYVDSIAFRVGTGLMNIMVWKMITGLCFGIVLGAVRTKTKNCYSTMLLHGVMNLFAR